MRYLIAVILCCLQVLSAKSQSFAINTDGSTAHASSILDVTSTNKGLLIPRMSKAQKNAITTPATGLLIYQTAPDSTGFYFYDGIRWQWLTDKGKTDGSYWGLHGNLNTNPPPPSNNTAIDFVNNTFLGTFNAADVSFVAGGNELIRLKQVPTGGRIGFSNRNPEYGLDMRLSDPAPPTEIVGMRIIPASLFDFNSTNLNRGLVLGYNTNNNQELALWSHSTSNINGVIRIGFGNFNTTERPALNINQHGLGIYQRAPRYRLDIHALSQYMPAVTSTGKNGMRITYRDQENSNNDQRGFFTGVSTGANTFKSFVWNYGDGTDLTSTNQAIYFGVGRDMDDGFPVNGPTMLMQNGKLSIGRINPATTVFPSTINIQTDLAADLYKKGISILNHSLVGQQELAYMGLDENNTNHLEIYNRTTSDIRIGRQEFSGLASVTIKANGNVGIGTTTPNAPLQIGNTNLLNRKIVLWELADNNQQYAGFSANNVIVKYQAPSTTASHVFYAGNNASSSFELLRISGNGNVGISNTTPQHPLSFSVDFGKKISLFPGATGDAGLGVFPNELRIHSDYNDADITFGYDDYTNGFTERVRMKANGNVGIGTNPNMPLSFAAVTGNKIALWGNNVNNHYGFGIQGFLFQMYCGGSGDNIAFGHGSSTNFTELMRIQGNGNVGIGITTPAHLLHVKGTASNVANFDGGSNMWVTLSENGVSKGYIGSFVSSVSADDVELGTISGNTTGAVHLTTNNIARLTVLNGGNVGIGTTTPTQRLHVIGNILASGTITPSDVRYKNNIQPVQSSLSKLLQLNGVTYFMNRSEFPEWNFDSTMQYGVIAQEVEKLFPEMVTVINDKGYKGVNYTKLIPVLIESVKEMNTKLEETEKENDDLKKQMLHLLKRVEALEKKQ